MHGKDLTAFNKINKYESVYLTHILFFAQMFFKRVKSQILWSITMTHILRFADRFR